MSNAGDWARACGGRPEVALITNHGYAGVEIPLGGAPDTGGQNFYVNQLAVALERLGYAVTIFARGGFPFFASEEIREGSERLSEHVRYVYVPGGGGEFIRKEDIAVALDEQVEWMDALVREEARRKGCRPWEVYEFVNSHYWDAAVIGIRLVSRWMDDVASERLGEALEGVVGDLHLGRLQDDRHWLAAGGCPALLAGRMLLEAHGEGGTCVERARSALLAWSSLRGIPLEPDAPERLAGRVEASTRGISPALVPLHASLELGEAVLRAWDPDGARGEPAGVDRHVWTPHSLGELKSRNYRNKPADVRRDLKFCERRDHEQVVCSRTRAFAATSLDIAEVLVSHHGVPAGAVFYFPPCVDRTLFRHYGSDEREATYTYLAGLSGVGVEEIRRGPIVFETSRMDRTKRKDVLLRAFAAAAHPTALLFIGGGPENDVFRDLASLRDSDPLLRRRAFLTGFLPDEVMYPLFDIADLFVTPSEMEGFGMSASQAAAAGTAIVTSDLVPFASLYVPEDAVVVPAGDVDGFAAAIGRLLGDREERTRRAGALSRATLALDWDVQAGRFLDHLRDRGIAVAPAGGGRKG